jgi:hypothetical protein
VDVTPYPFASDGNPLTAGNCANPPSAISCLTVTSFAFRAWNRGLAATRFASGNVSTFGVWIWNGTRWYPDPTFPGGSTCAGNTVLWAGKLDYWLIGQGAGWASLCRFDGADYVWEPLKLPAPTLARVTGTDGKLKSGGITSGACPAWNNCWFFGNFGTVVHWDGKLLTDDSPDTDASPWLGVEFAGSASATVAHGDAAGVTVAAAADNGGNPLTAVPETGVPAQVFNLGMTGWTPTPVVPPGNAAGTDLAAVALGPTGDGWTVGNPGGWFFLAPGGVPRRTRRGALGTAPAPIVPVAASGGTSTCMAPAGLTFTGFGSIVPPAGYPASYFWTAVSVDPTTGDALAAGEIQPGSSDALEPPPRSAFLPYEPVLVRATCSGTVTVTRFRDETVPSSNGPVVAPDATHAVAANATNDGWAATTYHVYRFTDGQAPAAPAGDDAEVRPVQLQQDTTPVVVQPPPASPLVTPRVVVTQTANPTKPAVTDVKTRLHVTTTRVSGSKHQAINLYISFKVNRAVTIGAEALRGKLVVATTGLRSVVPPRAVLVLLLSRKAWPTSLRFLTDAPRVEVLAPGPPIKGMVRLGAIATPVAGRTIASIRWDVAPAGSGNWTTIGTPTSPPFSVSFDTTTVAAGPYDIRAVATDNFGATGIGELKGVTFGGDA